MKYLLKFKKLFEYLSTKSRKMRDLINYFNLPLEDKILSIPKWFENVYPSESKDILSYWIHDNLNLFTDDLDGVDEDDYSSFLPSEVYFLTDEQTEKYAKYLYDFLMNMYRQSYSTKKGNYDEIYDVFPLFFTYDLINYVENDYLIHFTNSLDSVKNILTDGFIGCDNIDYLANTQIGMKYSDEYSHDGFVFGYEIDNGSINMSNDYGVIFKANSILVYHESDEEEQNIFIANEVDKGSMIGFHKIDNLYYTLDKKHSGETVEELFNNLALK